MNAPGTARERRWITAIMLGFGWEVRRQADVMNSDLSADRVIENQNNPTAVTSSWTCGLAEGLYFLDRDGNIAFRVGNNVDDIDTAENEEFDVDVRIRDGRGAEIVLVDRRNPERVLTTAEAASLFLDRLQNANI
jgi:hypothetical protein